MSLTPRAMAETAGTMLAALIGGALFNVLGMPVSWLAGPMILIAALAMYGVPLRLPPLLRDLGLMTAGVSLGSTVTAEALSTVQRYPWSLVGLVISIFLTVSSSKLILERLFGWDRATAFLASVPGALSMVMAIAAESTGDVRRIAVVQAVRLFALVAVMPLAISIGSAARPVISTQAAVVSPLGMLAMFLATFLVVAAMTKLRFANPLFLGGMMTGTVLHVTGLVPGELPELMTKAGMMVIGVFAGARFVGTTPRDVLRILVPGLVVLSVAMALSLATAMIVHWGTGLKLAEVLVAFAPGGLEAMVIMGAAMGLDTLYISTHHVIRAVGLNIVAPIFAPRRVE